MSYFSLIKKKNSIPIAKIDGGKYNNKIIYLVENDDNIYNLDKFNYDIMDYVYYKKDCDIKQNIIINDGKLIPLPRLDKRDIYYIAGAEGSGKSYFASLYIKEFKKIFPKRPFIIFSKIEDDKALNNLKPIRIKLDEELINDPINVEELYNSLVLFDDIDTINNKKILNNLQNLKDSILEIGRHHNIYILTTAHNMTNNKSTKMSLLESSNVVFFPNMGDKFHINRFLKEYVGLDKEQINKIYSLPSRWVLIYKRAPNYIMYEKGIYLL